MENISIVRATYIRSGFTLIELLIVIAIIGILAAVALPFYQGYVIGARLTEVTNAMGNVASAMAAYYQDKEPPSFPVCNSITDVQNSLGVSLGALDSNVTANGRLGSMSINMFGVITATIQNIGTVVDGKMLMLTPNLSGDGSLSWTWGSSADFPVHLMPKKR